MILNSNFLYIPTALQAPNNTLIFDIAANTSDVSSRHYKQKTPQGAEENNSFSRPAILKNVKVPTTAPSVKDSSDPICNLSKLDPWDTEAIDHFERQNPLICEPVLRRIPIRYNKQEGLYIFDVNLIRYQNQHGSNDFFGAACWYRFVEHAKGDKTVRFTSWQKVPARFPAAHDVMEFVCGIDGVTVFNKTFLHAIPQNITLRNISRIKRGRPPLKPLVESFKKPGIKNVATETLADKKYNVIMVMLDGTSRSNFIRQFPQSYLYMMESMDGIDFSKHVKIGVNTEPNILYGLLTGYGMSQTEKFPNDKGPYDKWPFIMYDFEDQGYVTLMSEDWDSTSLFVQYEGKGFWVQPFTHYARPFWVNIWNSDVKANSTKICYDTNPFHNISLNYVSEFIDAYPKTPKIGLVLIEKLTHNGINSGGMGDLDLWRFLQKMKLHRDDTFFFLFSDHGNNYSPFRQTKQGRFETALPIFTVSLPRAFEKAHPQLATNLRENSINAGFTTILDVHETLQDIASNFNMSRQPAVDKKGISFFRTLPSERTCSEAGVPAEFCMCFNDVELDPGSAWLKEPANAVLADLNLLLRAYKECAQLTLKKVTRALLQSPGHQHSNMTEIFQNPMSKVLLTLKASPGDALLEASVSYNKYQKKFRSLGFSSRLDKYGDQSYCVQNSALVRTYCFCKDQKKPG